MNTELYPHQLDAVRRMHNGCILYGKVGCGKSRTALAYIYICELGGSLRINGTGKFSYPTEKKDLYIITTAKKRDSLEWDEEVAYFGLKKHINVTVDSWNNIKKYQKVYGAVFIFDEQRLVGKGAWVKAFLKISRKNHWFLLSGTPGDNYSDYIPVMIANGYFSSRTQFEMEHCVFKPFITKYKEIDHYVNTKRLKYILSEILVKINYENGAKRHVIDISCDYDKNAYKRVMKGRWDIYEECPIDETGKLCYLLRRVSNSDESRVRKLMEILEQRPKAIIFYNFNYELDILREVCDSMRIRHNEWNGQLHEQVPEEGKTGWVYLCQYTAACEGWNCTSTDTIIFFSQNYSYKVTEQAAGRIDRANTPFKDLYYYHLRCSSPIDLAIRRSLQQKKNFNEKIFMRGVGGTNVKSSQWSS